MYVYIIQAGVTILMSVASRGNIEVTRALLEEGAQVNTEDNVSIINTPSMM